MIEDPSDSQKGLLGTSTMFTSAMVRACIGSLLVTASTSIEFSAGKDDDILPHVILDLLQVKKVRAVMIEDPNDS